MQRMQGDGVSRGEEALQVFQGAVQSRIPLLQGDGVSCGEAAMQVLQENSNPRGMGSKDPSRISALRSRDGEHVLEKLSTGVGEFCYSSVLYGGPSPGESTFFKLRKSFSWPLVDQNVSSLGVVPGSCSRHVGSIYCDRSNFLDSSGESSVGPVSLEMMAHPVGSPHQDRTSLSALVGGSPPIDCLSPSRFEDFSSG